VAAVSWRRIVVVFRTRRLCVGFLVAFSAVKLLR
jgi:hypothetical protein